MYSYALFWKLTNFTAVGNLYICEFPNYEKRLLNKLTGKCILIMSLMNRIDKELKTNIASGSVCVCVSECSGMHTESLQTIKDQTSYQYAINYIPLSIYGCHLCSEIYNPTI